MCLHGGGEYEEAMEAAVRGHAVEAATGVSTSDSRWSFEELKVRAGVQLCKTFGKGVLELIIASDVSKNIVF